MTKSKLPYPEAKRVPILEVARRLSLSEPVRRGPEWAVICPFHDDHHPSCYLNTRKNVWRCHVCRAGGNGIELVKRVMEIPFEKAVIFLVHGG